MLSSFAQTLVGIFLPLVFIWSFASMFILTGHIENLLADHVNNTVDVWCMHDLTGARPLQGAPPARSPARATSIVR